MTEFTTEVRLELEQKENADVLHMTVYTMDATGTALDDVTVSVHGPEERTSSTSKGAVAFRDLRVGDYTVRGNKGGYKTAEVKVAEQDYKESSSE